MIVMNSASTVIPSADRQLLPWFGHGYFCKARPFSIHFDWGRDSLRIVKRSFMINWKRAPGALDKCAQSPNAPELRNGGILMRERRPWPS